jgi:hypothetical protein
MVILLVFKLLRGYDRLEGFAPLEIVSFLKVADNEIGDGALAVVGR